MCLCKVKRQLAYKRGIYINNDLSASLRKKASNFLNKKGANSLNKKGTNSFNKKGTSFLNRKGCTLFNNEISPESLLTFGTPLLKL